MTFSVWNCRVVLSPLFMAVLTFLLLVDRTGQVPYVLLAVAIHELGHLFTMKASGVLPKRIEFRPFEVNIVRQKQITSFGVDLWIASAGVLANVLALAIFLLIHLVCRQSWLLTAAAAQFGVMLFNLLPVKSLDGWQILYCLGALTGGKEYQSKVLSAVSWLFTCGLLLVSVPLLIKNHNPTLLLFCLYIGVLQPMQQNRSA